MATAILNISRRVHVSLTKQCCKMSSYIMQYEPSKETNSPTFGEKQPKHLADGDAPCPPLVPDSLRMYNMRYCPYAQRVLLALIHKQIRFDMVNVHLKKKPQWFLDFLGQSAAKVPILQRPDGSTLGESLTLMQYLDAAYAGAPLLPSDPWQRARQLNVVEAFSGVTDKFQKFYFSKPDAELRAKLVKRIRFGMDDMERHLRASGGEYFAGANPGYADYGVWPWFERLPFLETLTGEPVLEGGRHDAVMAWVSSMQKHPTVKQTLVPREEMNAFMNSLADGNPNYDP